MGTPCKCAVWMLVHGSCLFLSRSHTNGAMASMTTKSGSARMALHRKKAMARTRAPRSNATVALLPAGVSGGVSQRGNFANKQASDLSECQQNGE